MDETVEAMKRAFEAFSTGRAVAPQRLSVASSAHDGVLLAKPALVPNEGLGAKLVSVFPRNAERGRPVISGLVILFDETTGEPVGLCDGAFLTAWRTGAASGAATDLLARSGIVTGAVIGCGIQGRTQAVAIDQVRRLETIRVFDTDREQMERFAIEMGPRLRARVEPVANAEDAVRGAGVVCTATTASEPVITSDWVDDGAHINGVGSFTPSMCEVDGATIARAAIFVDSREAARTEAGELIRAADLGATAVDDWTELGEVVNGSRPGRASEEELSFFKSVGLAVQDVVAAALAFSRAAERGIGSELNLG
jgi:ornithine cyclodeaminase